MSETIVCLASTHVESLALDEGFSCLDEETFARLFDAKALWLGPREKLETDEGFRQLVSYVVFRHEQSVLAYRRTPKGGETRLHGRLSVGVGGHVNVTDVVSVDGVVDLSATLRRAGTREISEEIACGAFDALTTVGIIKESTTPVSRVHLGVVVECWLEAKAVRALDPGLVDLDFLPMSDLAAHSDRMETWSSALIPYLRSSCQ